jgi:hypothetical protein
MAVRIETQGAMATVVYETWGMGLGDALAREYELGKATIDSGESFEGAARFAAGADRHGAPAS